MTDIRKYTDADRAAVKARISELSKKLGIDLGDPEYGGTPRSTPSIMDVLGYMAERALAGEDEESLADVHFPEAATQGAGLSRGDVLKTWLAGLNLARARSQAGRLSQDILAGLRQAAQAMVEIPPMATARSLTRSAPRSLTQRETPYIEPGPDWMLRAQTDLGSSTPNVVQEQVFLLVPPKGFGGHSAVPEFVVLVDGTAAEKGNVKQDKDGVWLGVRTKKVLGAACFTLEDGAVLVNLRTEPLEADKAGADVLAAPDNFVPGKPRAADAPRAKVAGLAQNALSGLLASSAGLLEWMLNSIENLGGAFGGSPRVASASSGHGAAQPVKSGPDHKNAADRRWRQGDLLLSLHSSKNEEFIVILTVEGNTSEKPVRLYLVDEASLKNAPNEAPSLKVYPIEFQSNGTYRVKIPVGIYSKRMRAIVSAEKVPNKGAVDVRLLLPVVEME